MGQKLQAQSSMLHRAVCTGQCISLSWWQRRCVQKLGIHGSVRGILHQRLWKRRPKSVAHACFATANARLALELTQLRKQTDASADRHLHELFAKTESVWW